jgi:hypothetical protein
MDDYMIIPSNPRPPHVPTANYSYMMMVSEHMVVRDGVGGGDGEETLNISLSNMDRRINLTCDTKIMDVAALCFAEISLPLARYVFRIYSGVRERRRRGDAPGPE